MKRLLATILLLAGHLPAGEETTGTLRLEDLFRATEPPSAAKPPGPSPRRRILIEVPNLDAWKATPTPVPTPTPDTPGLPSLPPLELESSKAIRFDERPFLADRGLARGGLRDGLAEVVLATRTEKALVRYEIAPADDPTSPTLVTMHPPGFEERFLLPAGEYVVSQQVWFGERPSSRAGSTFPAQTLTRGFRYEGATEPAAEREARVRIEMMKTRPR